MITKSTHQGQFQLCAFLFKYQKDDPVRHRVQHAHILISVWHFRLSSIGSYSVPTTRVILAIAIVITWATSMPAFHDTLPLPIAIFDLIFDDRQCNYCKGVNQISSSYRQSSHGSKFYSGLLSIPADFPIHEKTPLILATGCIYYGKIASEIRASHRLLVPQFNKDTSIEHTSPPIVYLDIRSTTRKRVNSAVVLIFCCKQSGRWISYGRALTSWLQFAAIAKWQTWTPRWKVWKWTS